MPIVVVDVTLQPSIQLLDIPEVREIEILGFQGGEEAFHGRIVEAIALSRHALLHSVSGQSRSIRLHPVVPALAGMEQRPIHLPAFPCGFL